VSSPLAVYAQMLEGAPGDHHVVRFADGSGQAMGIERWKSGADDADERALAGLHGPVLDIGCGPGRHLHALARRGVFALGVDISAAAVGLARAGGGRAIVGSVFDEVPRAGSWGGALLLDGNIGIGGCPERLLSRVRTLLAPDGEIVVELADPTRLTVETRIRLEATGIRSDWFDWAEVSVRDVDRVLGGAGWVVVRRWRHSGRWFALARGAT
jgi:SAM-dependent methyltransferase